MQYGELLSNAVAVALMAPFLALVPLITGLSRWTDVTKTASRSGTRVGIHFGMPISVPLSLVVNAGLVGVVLAAVVASGAGHVLTTFAVLFTRDLVGLEPVPVSEGAVADGAAVR